MLGNVRGHVIRLSVLLLLGPSGFLIASEPILLTAEVADGQAYAFTAEDEKFLDEVQQGCFNYLWHEVGSPAALVRDRLTVETSSAAAVGFQLSSLPIGVERGWVTRHAAEQRALTILRHLRTAEDNRKFGIYLHFLDRNTAGLDPQAPQVQASTVDHALLTSGAIPAAVYFGGEVRRLVDELIAESDWSKFSTGPNGLLSFGWRPDDRSSLDGSGHFRPWYWHAYGAEEALCYFQAAACPDAAKAIDPAIAYAVKRKVDRHGDMEPYVVSWNGSMFTYFFDHCWIDYRRYESDSPEEFGGSGPRVNWFENSRRAFVTHRRRCLEKSSEYKSLGENRWGLGPCMGIKEFRKPSYLVQDLLPNHSGLDLWREGTVAPYVAGAAMPFLPAESLAALREMQQLTDENGRPLVWRTPASGGYGFVDSFNLDQNYVAEEYIGIDVGPMLLLIENARTGLIWDLFHQHPQAERGAARLGWLERPQTNGETP